MVATRDSSDAALTIGRFAGWEPLGFEAGDNNWYRFVENGPTERTDSLGLSVHPDEITTAAGCRKWQADRMRELYGRVPPWTALFQEVMGAIIKKYRECVERIASLPPRCTFMVRGDVTGNATADRCGCMHVDLYSTCNGELRTGFGGSVDPRYVPTSPTQIDPKRDTVLTVHFVGTLLHGAAAGTACHLATHEQIVSCIVAAPRPQGDYHPITNNCRQDVSSVARACCLVGF